MSYLERLIERATDSTLNLMNNKIGSYKITCQHGSFVFVYHIYKNDEHLFTLNITNTTIIIVYSKNTPNDKEISDVHHTVKKLYDGKKEISIRQL